MEDEKLINLANVVSIDVFLKKENTYLSYNFYSKFLWIFTIFKDGWYLGVNWLTSDYILSDEYIPKNTYIIDLRAYFYPHIVFNLTDKSKYYSYFENETQLRDKLTLYSKDINLIRFVEK